MWHDWHVASSLPKSVRHSKPEVVFASGEEREASFADAAADLRKDVPEDQVLHITVTCDGTLARRGFQSLYGIVVEASWKSGKVLDVEVLSKHCQACATRHGMDTSSDEFSDWWEGHRASCEVNYCGSSSVMESTGVPAIWKRSVSKNKLRYIQMISDGDSKTFKLLSDQLPYGASNLVSKHECVGHVQKRMGKTLREKAKEKFVNESGERVKMRGNGRLTDKTIKLLTHCCSQAVTHPSTGQAQRFGDRMIMAKPSDPTPGDCVAMQYALWAVFYHFQSTDSSTSIASVASGLGASSTGHLPIPSHLHPTHPPSIQTWFLLSKRSLSDSLTYTNGALHTWSEPESERVIQ